MIDFWRMAIPKVGKDIVKKELKYELMQAWYGIINGDNGGGGVDWRLYVYRELYDKGLIDQTEYCIKIYGDFKNN